MNIEIIKEGLEIKGVRLELGGVKHCTSDIRQDGSCAILCMSESTLSNDKYGLDKSFQKCINIQAYETQQIELIDFKIEADNYLTYILFPKSVLDDLKIVF